MAKIFADRVPSLTRQLESLPKKQKNGKKELISPGNYTCTYNALCGLCACPFI